MGTGLNSTTYADMRVLLVYASEQERAIAADWNALFFWKQHSRKVVHCDDHTKAGLEYGYIRYDRFNAQECFDECVAACTGKNPAERYEHLSDDCETEYPMFAYEVIMYERTVQGPVVQELAELQEAMEGCLKNIDAMEVKRMEAYKGQKSLFRKKREESQRQIDEATAAINGYLEDFDLLLARLKKLRAAVLGG